MAIREQYRPGDQIVVIGLYENASSLNFYTGLPLHSLHAPGGNMWYGDAVSRSAAGFGDTGIVCRDVEWPAARFLVDRRG